MIRIIFGILRIHRFATVSIYDDLCSMKFKTRFAPSPNGRLHIGHIASALFVWSIANRFDGEVLLRIEDTDITRCKPEFTQFIYDDLNWLGLKWPEPVRIQSEHFYEYDTVRDILSRQGLLYRCFKSRSEINNLAKGKPFRGKPLRPSEEMLLLENGHPFSWRLSLENAKEKLGQIWNDLDYQVSDGKQHFRHPAKPEIHGDIIVAGKESPTAYHVASTHDDALQGITHVIRGEDLEDAPHIHRLLQVLMGWPEPIYIHHTLVVDSSGQKLSKRFGASSIDTLKERNISKPELESLLRLKIVQTQV